MAFEHASVVLSMDVLFSRRNSSIVVITDSRLGVYVRPNRIYFRDQMRSKTIVLGLGIDRPETSIVYFVVRSSGTTLCPKTGVHN